tara:strand:+ start:6 stop:1433 length:1428 start_codon:yes stop_codon:yes gene_type:complete
MDSKPKIVNFIGIETEVVPFKPVWETYNNTAIRILELVLNSLPNVPTSTTRFDKYKIVVSSFLALAQTVSWKDNGVISIPKTRTNWSEFPSVGASIIENVRNDLVEAGYITQVPNSGQRHFWEDEDEVLQWVGIQALYTIEDSLYNLEGFTDAEWIEVGRPTVLVGKFESVASKIKRKEQGLRKPRMPLRKTIEVFGKDYRIASKQVKSLNTFWRQHPLALPPLGNHAQQYTSCATRIYHDGAMDSGGRYYSSYSNFSTQFRLQSKIDGEEIVEVDINASQPTLFSALMGMKMEVGKTWTDLYTDIIASNENLKGLDQPDDLKRKKLKQVAVEIIGTGNPDKKAPAATGDLVFSNKFDEYGWYRNQLIRSVPALSLLDPNYLNGSGFVSFHEAEIMSATLTALMDLGVVAYPMHDCLIIKKSNKDIGVETYRKTINEYILNHCKSNNRQQVSIIVPVSIEELNKDKVRLHGSYNG